MSVGPTPGAKRAVERIRNPHTKLADLVARECGIEVEPRVLKAFLLKRFERISILAHAIHGEAA